MLYNLLLALQHVGDEMAGREVITGALKLPGSDSTAPSFRICAALEAVLQNESGTASELIREVVPSQLAAYDDRTYRFVEALLEFALAGTKPKFGKKHREVLGRFLESNQKNGSMAKAFTRGARFISQQTGTPWPVIWAWLKKYGALTFALVSACGTS